MAKWPWTERGFSFDFPASKFPDILERFRGTPARVEERVAGLSRDLLTRRDGNGWSIQENVGHLLVTERLPSLRIEEILSGESVLTAADMTNRRTNEADHNNQDIRTLVEGFRAERDRLVRRLEGVSEEDWSRSALHPRLNKPMRLVDLVFFHAEHDDYHLARISELRRAFE